MKTIKKLGELIFPECIYCSSCGSIIDGTREYGLCDKCITHFKWANSNLCDKCGKPMPSNYVHKQCIDCRNIRHEFEKGFTCASYGLYERMLISDFKERGKSHIATSIARVMYDRMKGEPEILAKVDFIIPVPISERKLKSRGYNQTELIADGFGKLAGIEVKHNILKRSKETKSMKTLDAAERRANVQDAFGFISTKNVTMGKTLLVIDDVYTTGSTLDSCARVLKRDGKAAKIYVLTFAAGSNRIVHEESQEEA